MKGFRFQRQFQILPWVKLNLSKSGISATVGPDDLHFTLGKDGTYVYADVPGKGTYYRRKLGALTKDMQNDEDKTKKAKNSEKAKNDSAEGSASPADGDNQGVVIEEKIRDLGMLERLIASNEEVALADALKALHAENFDLAYSKAKQASKMADGAFLTGFLAFRYEDWEIAVKCFEHCLANLNSLGTMLARFDASINAYLPVTDDLVVALQPTQRDCLLALSEARQRIGQYEAAIQPLKQLRQEHDTDDLVVRLMLAELYDEVYSDNEEAQHELVQLAEGVENESPLHATLMYYRARALRRLNLLTGAKDTLTKAMRKKKDYPADLLAHLQYERALIYEAEGDSKKAQAEFEKIYAAYPNLQDVAERLGLSKPVGDLPPVS